MCGVLHGLVPYPVKCVQSLQKKDLRPDFPVQACGLNEKIRREPDLFLLLS